jgi:hypothetical protein
VKTLTGSGEDGFLGNGNVDLGISGVEVKSGASVITFTNKGEIPMPVVFQITFEDDTKEVRTLPVEVWYKGNEWNYLVKGDKGIKAIEIDPGKFLPDIDIKDNSWKKE